MKLYILKTDIETRWEVEQVKAVLDTPQIYRWTVDIEDIDHVLRVEASSDSEEHDIIELVKNEGFLCEALPD